MKEFALGTEDIVAEKIFGHNVAMTFNRRQLFLFQYVKLLNYFGDDLVPEWGGSYIPSEQSERAPVAAEKFVEHAMSFPDLDGNVWITKRHETQPWSEVNLKLTHAPCQDLGAPYEAYLTYDGAMLTINQASRILCVDSGILVGLKLKLLYDEIVVLEAIKRMLRPRPQWPKIAAKQGGKGRSFRFAKS